MTVTLIPYNNITGNLGAQLSSGGTTITFAKDPGFATLTGTQAIKLCLEPETNKFEILYLTAFNRSSPLTGTVTRAAEDGTNWPAVEHDVTSKFVCAVTASDLAAAGGGPPTGAAGGDLGGTYPNPAVDQVQGVAITAAEATLLSQLNGALARNTSSLNATAGAGETTILTGSTGGKTLTMPAAPQNSTENTIVNISSVNVTIAAGAGDAIDNEGTTGSITLAPNTSIEMTYLDSSTKVWYVTATGGIGGSGTSVTVNPVTASASAAANEVTIFSGSTAAQTITLPTAPGGGTENVVVNNASVSVTVAASGTINNQGTTGSITLASGTAVSLVYRTTGTTWYVYSNIGTGGGGGVSTIESTDGSGTWTNEGGGTWNLTNAGLFGWSIVTSGTYSPTGPFKYFANPTSGVVTIDMPQATGSGAEITVVNIVSTAHNVVLHPFSGDQMNNGSISGALSTSDITINALGTGGTWKDTAAGEWIKVGAV